MSTQNTRFKIIQRPFVSRNLKFDLKRSFSYKEDKENYNEIVKYLNYLTCCEKQAPIKMFVIVDNKSKTKKIVSFSFEDPITNLVITYIPSHISNKQDLLKKSLHYYARLVGKSPSKISTFI